MSSDRKIQPARENGRKSRGPVALALSSWECKARAARNAGRHGLCAQSLLLDRESTDSFNEIVRGHHDEFRPETPSEVATVEVMVFARWRQRRFWTLERCAINHEIRSAASGPAATPAADPRSRAALMKQRPVPTPSASAPATIQPAAVGSPAPSAASPPSVKSAKKVNLRNEPNKSLKTKGRRSKTNRKRTAPEPNRTDHEPNRTHFGDPDRRPGGSSACPRAAQRRCLASKKCFWRNEPGMQLKTKDRPLNQPCKNLQESAKTRQ